MSDKEQYLPASWEIATLTDVTSKPQYGFTTKASNSGTLRLIRTSDITSPTFDWAHLPYCTKTPDSPEKFQVQHGDILISRAGSVGVSHLVNGDGHAVFASYLIRFKPRISPDYVYWFTKSPEYWMQIADSADGITVQNVNAKKLSNLRVPVPPEPEQGRIVAKIEELLSELDDSVANLLTARARLQTYRQSLLKHAFEGRLTEQWRRDHADELESADQLLERIREERQARYQEQLEHWKAEVVHREADGHPGKKPRKPKAPKALPDPSEAELDHLPDLSNGWSWIRLGEAAEVAGGLTKNPKRETLKVKRPFLRVANVYANRLDLDEIHEIGVEERELPKVTLEQGDLLVVEGNGSVDQIGRVALWEEKIPGAVHQNHLIRARPASAIHSAFALWFLLSKQGRDHIMRVASSTSGLHTLSLSKVENLLVPVCSPNEQRFVVDELEAKLSRVEEAGRAIESAIHKTKTLRQSILKRAFEGRLVPQNPADEPASELLARIRGEEPEHVEAVLGGAGTQAKADA